MRAWQTCHWKVKVGPRPEVEYLTSHFPQIGIGLMPDHQLPILIQTETTFNVFKTGKLILTCICKTFHQYKHFQSI
jgi:hypothetical protein